MPIYAYRCSNCGHEQDVLQKMSDAPLTQCPSCGQSAYAKQVTAAGFQLKGSGWYVTDFRNNGAKPATGAGKSADSKTADSKDIATTTTPADKTAASSTASAAAPSSTAPSSTATPSSTST